MKKLILIGFFVLFASSTFLFADSFNDKLTQEERTTLAGGNILIRNIDFYRNICLELDENDKATFLKEEIKKLHPQYLAEIIQYKPYAGNEDLPERLRETLYNVGDYAGIPYYSEHNDRWYDLYDSAKIVEETKTDSQTELKCIFEMAPFGTVDELITIEDSADSIVYVAVNQNKLRYHDKFDAVYPQKMKICIFLFRDGDNWVLYGIGGVNAPRIPFFTERIEVSFINRIKTFCNFIFTKF